MLLRCLKKNRRHDETPEELKALEREAATKCLQRAERISKRLLTPSSNQFYKEMAKAAARKLVGLGLTLEEVDILAKEE